MTKLKELTRRQAAAILQAVVDAPHPRLAKPNIAKHHNLTFEDLETVLGRHGYPNHAVMRRHIAKLLEDPTTPVTPAAPVAATAPAAPATAAPAPAPPPTSTPVTASVADAAPQSTTEDLTESPASQASPAASQPPAPRPAPPTTTVAQRLAPGPGQPAGERDRMQTVQVARVTPDPDNVRENLTDIEDLAASITEIGLLEPILVRTVGHRLVVVAGHRRLAAVRLLGWTHVDVVIKANLRSSDVLAAMLIENNQRVDLDPIEEARALKRIKADRKIETDLELAKLVGRSQPFVSGRLALLSLSAADQDAVRAGNMKLIEATHRGRLNSGKLGKTGVDRNWHLGPQHELSNQAKARCKRLQHPRGRTVGGIACGDCWEHVIRAHERVQLVEHSHDRGSCPTCGSTVKAAQ